jgi:tetratricopeptide (TPR) repeat protein
MEDRLKMIEEMLITNPTDPFLLYAISLEYKKIGDSSTAIQKLEDLVLKIPNYLGSYYQLGKLYESENQLEKAIEIYKKGKIIATEKSDPKTLGELNEAIYILEDYDS